jgi:hypothetical protein
VSARRTTQQLGTDFIQVDIAKLASLSGMTNKGSASNAWAKIKKKLAAKALEVTGDADGSATTTTTSTPKPKATPRKRAKAELDEDGSETPTKKAKATPKGRGKKTAAEDENLVPVKAEHDVADEGSEGDEVLF